MKKGIEALRSFLSYKKGKIPVKGYGQHGGVVGNPSFPSVNPVIVIVVADEDTARTLVDFVPDSVIVGKLRKHILETGSSGLIDDISKALGRGY
jgi:hypothetical protein